MMRSFVAVAVLSLALCALTTNAIRVPALDTYNGAWSSTSLTCSGGTNSSRVQWVTFTTDGTDSFIIVTTAAAGSDLSSVSVLTISSANVVQARVDSYDAATGYVSFTDVWPKNTQSQGCMRIIPSNAAPSTHAKRHGGPHAVFIQMSSTKAACTGGSQLPAVPEVTCADSNAPSFMNLTYVATQCSTPACRSLVGQFTGTVTVRSNALGGSCPSDPYVLTPSYMRIFNVSGAIHVQAFVKGPLLPAYDQPVPMVVTNYDAQTGNMRLITFYSTRQCITVNTALLAQGRFFAAVPVGPDAAAFNTCPAAGITAPVGCDIAIYDFAADRPPVAAPVAPSPTIPAPRGLAPASSASMVEIFVAYLTIAVVAAGLLLLQ